MTFFTGKKKLFHKNKKKKNQKNMFLFMKLQVKFIKIGPWGKKTLDGKKKKYIGEIIKLKKYFL